MPRRSRSRFPCRSSRRARRRPLARGRAAGRPSRRGGGLAAETLEPRRLLAAGAITATIANQVLTIVGDDQSSSLSVQVTDSSVVLTPAADTAINGQAAGLAVTLPGVARGLKADLKGGDDFLTCAPSAALALPAGITVQLGSGNNTLVFSTPDQKLVLGPLAISAGAGDDEVTIAGQAGSTVAGPLALKLGDGSGGVTLANLIVTGPLVSVDGGIGGDLVNVTGLSGTAGLAVKAGPGKADVRIASTTLAAVTVAAEEPTVSAETSTLASVAVTGQFDTRLELGKANVSGAVTAAATGSGGDVDLLLRGFAVGGDMKASTAGMAADVRVTLDAVGGAASAAGNLLARAAGPNSSVVLTLNSAVDFPSAKTVALQASGVGGSVRAVLAGRLQAKAAALSLAAGAAGGTVSVVNDAGFRVAGASFTAGGDVSVAGSDAGTSSVLCQNDLALKSATGTVRLAVPAALDVRHATLDGRNAEFSFGGAAPDTDEVRGALAVRAAQRASVSLAPGALFKVVGGLTCTAGLDAALAAATPSSALEVGGGCTLRGTNVDTTIGAKGQFAGGLAVTASRRSVTTLSSAKLGFAQPVTITGGVGDDLFQAGPGAQFGKGLALKLGEGRNSLTMTGSTEQARRPTVGGGLSILSGSGADEVTLTDLLVAGTTSLATGGGADRVSLGGASTFAGNVTLATGGGGDTLAIGTRAGSSAPVTFQGALAADLGAENDLLRLGVALAAGGEANSRVEFTKTGSKILGGPGVNRFDKAGGQYAGLPDGSLVGFTTPATS